MSEFSARPQLKLPMQAAPVDRVPGPAALNGGSGIEAAWGFEDLWGSIAPALPGIATGLASLI
jgi:hypothetical protein